MDKASMGILRKEVNRRFFEKSEPKRSIMREMDVSWNFVRAWTQAKDQDFTADARGWKAGVSRKHPADIKSRIIAIRERLEEDPDEFFSGDLAIQQQYADAYPSDPVPGIGYINDIIRAAGLAKTHHKKRRGTAIRYLCYPQHCITRVGEHIADVDHIGHKFVGGISEPVHFLSVAYRNPRRLRCIQRVSGETTEETIAITNIIFDDLGWPDAVKTDVGAPFAGRTDRKDGKGARSVPQFAINLLLHETTPIYGNPRSPWNQGTGEGSNSVFGRNFWNANEYTSTTMIDERLVAFNASAKKYARYKPWIREKKDSFVPRICFIRRAAEDAWGKNGIISIAGEPVILSKEYIGYYTFSEWNLKEEKLEIFFEREGEIQKIEERGFEIHPRSRERCTHFIT
jgi:hypothetical protein